MKTQMKLAPGAKPLTKNHRGDAGYDLAVMETYPLSRYKVGDKFLISTGVSVALPPGIWGHIMPRSSTLSRYGLQVIPAVIDNGYTGELFVQAVVVTLDRQYHAIDAGGRVAQFVPQEIVQLDIEVTDKLDTRDRGERGFGSTGR